MNNFIKIATVVGLALVFLAIPFMTGWWLGEKRAFDRFEPHTDTLFIPREIVVEKPVEVVKWRTRLRTEIVMLASAGTVTAIDSSTTVCDSVLVEVPIEQRVFADSNYTAFVSGWRPVLDSIRITAPTMVIKETVKQKAPRFGFGIAAGPSVIYNGSVHAGIGVTAGIMYHF